jgi:signal transduction histidine kinase
MLSPRRSRPPSIRDEHASYSRWTGQFVDRSVEKVYRELQFAQDRAQALAVFGALGTVWCALTVFSWFYQDELIALIRLLVLCLFPVFLWRLDTPERFDQRVLGLFCVGWVGIPLVLWLGSTPTPYVLMWMGVFLLGTTTWGVLPVPFLAVSHLVAISTMSVVVLSRGESMARVAALGASLFSCSLAFAVTSSLRARRLQAAVWRSEALVEDRELLLAAVAHQLRTPLAATLMALEVARQAPERADDLYQRMRSSPNTPSWRSARALARRRTAHRGCPMRRGSRGTRRSGSGRTPRS